MKRERLCKKKLLDDLNFGKVRPRKELVKNGKIGGLTQG